jgi:hypothetical protein
LGLLEGSAVKEQAAQARQATVALVAALLLPWAPACGAPAAPPAAAAPSAATAANSAPFERFLPLKNDTVYTYNVWVPGQDTPEVLILEVERPSKERARLKTGSSIKRLEVVADGVRMVTGGYLLKPPFAVGATWLGPAGRVEVSAMDQAVEVPAGNFVGCVETTESARGGGEQRIIVTSYCPDVGIARFSVESSGEMQRFELKSFGERVDINKL